MSDRKIVPAIASIVVAIAACIVSADAKDDRAANTAIDAACAPFANAASGSADAPAGVRTLLLMRSRTTGAFGDWKTGSASDRARLISSRSFVEVQSVTAFAVRKTLAYAEVEDASSTGDTTTRQDFCYQNGKLTRANVVFANIKTMHAWNRTVHYEPSGSIEADSGSIGAGKPPAGALDVPPFTAPEKMPFYKAFLSAL